MSVLQRRPVRRLWRRLCIVCPETGRPAEIGFELSELPRLSGRRHVLVDCLECGRDHEWQVEETLLA